MRPIKQELPREDFDMIDGFFQSFACRFRDKKAAYLRKMYVFCHSALNSFENKNLIDFAFRTALREKPRNTWRRDFNKSWRELVISIESSQR